MAPNEAGLAWQTNEIIKHFLEDDEVDECSPCSFSSVEPDCPSGSDDNFNAARIAGKLKSVANSLNDNVAFREAVAEFKEKATHGAIEAAFSHSLNTLCQSGRPHCPDLELLKISLSLGSLAAKSYPHLRNQISSAMTAFITSNLGRWIAEQGGWESINI